MGNLVDTFIITPNDDGLNFTDDQIIKSVPKKYRFLLGNLLEKFQLGAIMDYSNSDTIDDFITELEDKCDAGLENEPEIGTDYWSMFTDRFRGECLQQILRKRFFKTLSIIVNDYSPDKVNKFIVVNSDSSITEKE